MRIWLGVFPLGLGRREAWGSRKGGAACGVVIGWRWCEKTAFLRVSWEENINRSGIFLTHKQN